MILPNSAGSLVQRCLDFNVDKEINLRAVLFNKLHLSVQFVFQSFFPTAAKYSVFVSVHCVCSVVEQPGFRA